MEEPKSLKFYPKVIDISKAFCNWNEKEMLKIQISLAARVIHLIKKGHTNFFPPMLAIPLRGGSYCRTEPEYLNSVSASGSEPRVAGAGSPDLLGWKRDSQKAPPICRTIAGGGIFLPVPFRSLIENSKTILWNDPVVVFEMPHFSNGTSV
jgi:hypothetical protein